MFDDDDDSDIDDDKEQLGWQGIRVCCLWHFPCSCVFIHMHIHSISYRLVLETVDMHKNI